MVLIELLSRQCSVILVVCAIVMELVRCDKCINAAEFLQICGKELISSIQKCVHDERVADGVFQHDNAPAHTTKVTKHSLQCISMKTMFYLGKSLEMNPIENQAYIYSKLAIFK